MITIISIGKNNQYQKFISEYEKRLVNNFKIKWIDIKQSNKKYDECRNDESKMIMEYIKEKDYTILLDERGTQIDNFKFTKILQTNNNIVIIIGGSYGVNEELRKKVNFMWSLSTQIFPYELVKLILTEQIYRSQMISMNHPYHHE